MEDTIRFDRTNGMDTIPMICEENKIQLNRSKMRVGTEISEYELIALMSVTPSSELWFGKDYSGARCVVKITENQVDMELIQRIRVLECENLVPVIDCGMVGRYWYEVYPYYKNGHLEGVLEEKTIQDVVLPGLIRALNQLHGAEMIHNDIKPENIFWNDEGTEILLGDYGCVSQVRTVPKGITPAYAAPELLLNDVCRRSSDWASVGLCLAKLVSGELLIDAKNKNHAMNIWEKGVRLTKGSVGFQRLINGMINVDRNRRLGPTAALNWCEGTTFGGEERKTIRKEVTQAPLTVSFTNPSWIAADIEGLIAGIETHWEYSVFLFKESKFDRFLSQFDKEWVEVCKQYRKLAHSEDALFRLTLDLTGNGQFVWRGKRYSNLLEMEQTWEENQTGEKDIISFLQKGHVVFYMEKHNAQVEQIAFAKRLQDISRVHPSEACIQLFQALRGNDGLAWGAAVLNDLNDLVDYLAVNVETLDREIEAMFNSKRFEAWLAYQGLEDVLEEIRRKCEV